jgi:hypothetical protein
MLAHLGRMARVENHDVDSMLGTSGEDLAARHGWRQVPRTSLALDRGEKKIHKIYYTEIFRFCDATQPEFS